jgi:hypothetical protein
MRRCTESAGNDAARRTDMAGTCAVVSSVVGGLTAEVPHCKSSDVGQQIYQSAGLHT